MSISELITKIIGDKRRWRAYKARTRQLPAPYHMAVEAIERYLMYFGPGDGETSALMLEDLADLFERAAADGTPVRSVVGDDPVEFVDDFRQNYYGTGWVSKQKAKLIDDRADRWNGSRP